MSKSLILDWQKNSLMLARAQGRSSKVAIDGVAIQQVGNTDSVQQTAQEALRAAAQELQAKGEVSVLLARELVELRTVQIPKMDADELPDVIRYQAQRQFANMTDAWTVDFVLLPPVAGNEMQTALVAAISPAQIAEIDSACSSAGLQAVSIGLKPLQIVHMAIDAALVASTGRSMIVCVSDGIADLLILREGKIVQVRSTKLPYEADQLGPTLQGEVRRSLVAAAAELESKPLDSILLIASASRSPALQSALRQTTAANVTVFHPETLLSQPDTALADLAGSRLAAIAGAVGLKTADRASIVDFKNPKRRPPKKRDSRKWLLIGGAAATLLVAAVGWYYSTVNGLDEEYSLLQAELDANKESGEAARKRLAEFAAIEKFASDAPNWLDELVYVSEKIPGSDKVMLQSPSFTIGRNGVGEISVGIKATDTSSFTKFANSLSNQHYKVSPGTTQELPKPDGKYRYRGDVKIDVTGKGWDLSAPAVTPKVEADATPEAKPASDESSEEPKTEEPKTEEPKTEEPKTEEPKTEEPKTEEPKTEEPKTEEPKTEEPKTEEPKTEEPKTEEPKTEPVPPAPKSDTGK